MNKFVSTLYLEKVEFVVDAWHTEAVFSGQQLVIIIIGNFIH